MAGGLRIKRARQSGSSIGVPAVMVAAAVAILVSFAGAQSGGGDVVADLVLGQTNFTSNAPNAGASNLAEPFAVAIDRHATPNHIYIADSANNRVLGWSDLGALVNGAAADLVIGQSNFIANLSGNGPDGLPSPSGLAVDSAGNLYVVNEAGVYVYLTPYARGCSVANPCVGQPASMVIGTGPTGDNFARITCAGPPAGGPIDAAYVCAPSGVALDSSDNLYIADSFDNRVLEYDQPLGSSTGCATPGEPGCAGDAVADRVFGQGPEGNQFSYSNCANGVGPNPMPSAMGMCRPGAVALDSNDNLYVADTANNRVLEFDQPIAHSNFVANRVLGQGAINNFSTIACDDGGSAPLPSAIGMCQPTGLAFDSHDELFVADRDDNRVLEFATPLVSSAANRVFGQGAAGDDFIDNDCADGEPGDPLESASGMCGPTGVALDSADNLYVADYYNNRVLEFLQPFGTSSISATPRSTPGSATPVATATATSTPTATPTATASGLISVSPSSVEFPKTKVGHTAKHSIVIRNTAATPLSGTVESAIGLAFSISSGAGSFTLAKGKTRTVTLTFAPASVTSFSASLTIDSSDLGKTPLVVPLSGSGK